jgi:hypothetical protein
MKKVLIQNEPIDQIRREQKQAELNFLGKNFGFLENKFNKASFVQWFLWKSIFKKSS